MPLTPLDLLQLSQGAPPVANPEDQGTGLDYAQLLGYGAPTPTPESATPVAPQPIQPGTAMGVGTSASGFSPGAYNAIQQGPGRKIDKQMAGERQAVGQEFAPIQKKAQGATEAALGAQDALSTAESAKIAATAEGRVKIAQANNDFLTKEAAAVENAKAESLANMAQYKAALADYAASRINPSQLWEQSGTGGQVAMLVTAFGHDFLGAKGIQTSGLDSIKTAIQNNISSQLENMRKKGDVAQGFKQLWDMQRAQSASDAEARARMNGFYLSAVSNEIEAKLGAYDSQLAQAKGQAAKAALLQEQVKNDLLVQQHIDASANQRVQQRVQVYSADLSASASRYSADAHIRAAQIAAAAKEAKSSPLDGLIFDTSKSGANKADRRFLPDVKPDDRVRLREQNAKVINTGGKIQYLIELQDAIDKVPPTDIAMLKKMQGEAARAAEQVRTLVRTNLLYDSTGKAVNEKEMEIFNEIVAKKDWWTNGDNTRTLAILGKANMDKQKEIMSAVSTKLQPDDPAYGATSGDNDTASAESTLFDIQSQPGAGKKQETRADVLVKDAEKPDGLQPAYESKSLLGIELNEPDNEKPVPQWAHEQQYKQFLQDNPGQENKAKKVPKAFAAIDSLANMAQQGDEAAQAELSRLSAPIKDSSKLTDTELLIRQYAAWEKGIKGL